jgi:hypothetical protein
MTLTFTTFFFPASDVNTSGTDTDVYLAALAEIYQQSALGSTYQEGVITFEELTPQESMMFEMYQHTMPSPADEEEDEEVEAAIVSIVDDSSSDADEGVTVSAVVAVESPRGRRKGASTSPKKQLGVQRKRFKSKAAEHFRFEEILTLTVVSDDEGEDVDIDC